MEEREPQYITSVWNKAGTWEERNETKWGLETLQAKLENMIVELTDVVFDIEEIDSITVSIPAIKKIAGDIRIASVRGKTRYLYDFDTIQCDISFRCELSDSPNNTDTLMDSDYSGILTLNDVSNDDHDIEVILYFLYT